MIFVLILKNHIIFTFQIIDKTFHKLLFKKLTVKKIKLFLKNVISKIFYNFV